MNTLKRAFAIGLLIAISSCTASAEKEATDRETTAGETTETSPDSKKQVCDESSEWRDHNGPDYCSYYSKAESCDKLIGRLNMISRLHKGSLEKDVFEGGMSSRWFEIGEKSIVYFKPSGEVADRGTCDCENGMLKINWEHGDNVPEESTIYFRSADTVELRYHDAPFSMRSLQSDASKPKTNPTKILGVVKRD